MFCRHKIIFSLNKMITNGPELDRFVVEPGMKIEPFNPKLFNEINLNHPYKILLHYLYKHPPNYSRWDDEDINDFYFSMLDDYNKYEISFQRENNLFPDNNLYVIENDNSKKEHFEIHFDSKYKLLFNNHYDKKTLLFNKAKKIDLNKHDKGYKPLSEWEQTKRNFIRNQKNKYLQVAMMDPDVYNNDELFKNLMKKSDDYYSFLDYKYHLTFIDDYLLEEDAKKDYKIQIAMIRKLLYRINKGNDEYLGIINDKNSQNLSIKLSYISPKSSDYPPSYYFTE